MWRNRFIIIVLMMVMVVPVFAENALSSADAIVAKHKITSQEEIKAVTELFYGQRQALEDCQGKMYQKLLSYKGIIKDELLVTFARGWCAIKLGYFKVDS